MKFSYHFSCLDSTSEILTLWPIINPFETNNLWQFIDEYCKLVCHNRSNLTQVAKVKWVMSNGCPKLLVTKVPTSRYWVKGLNTLFGTVAVLGVHFPIKELFVIPWFIELLFEILTDQFIAFKNKQF